MRGGQSLGLGWAQDDIRLGFAMVILTHQVRIGAKCFALVMPWTITRCHHDYSRHGVME
jgi:hypothetical protein